MNLTPWFDIYEKRMNDRYLEHVKKKYSTFINEIIEYHRRLGNTTFVEFGCGAANISRILAEKIPGSHHVLVDNCSKMLELAAINMQGHSFEICKGDIRCPDVRNRLMDGVHSRSIAHSHGVLEHFNNVHIRDIIYTQNNCSTPRS